MIDGRDLPAQEAHGELSLARVALAEGDLAHAANHLAGAMVHAPRLPEVHELLAELAGRSGGGLDLFPLTEHAYLGTVLAHAHLLSRTNPAGALQLLAQATAYEPGQPWADVPWVRALDPREVAPDPLARMLVTVMSSLRDPAPPPVRAANEVYLDLTRRALAAYPQHGTLHGAAAGLARRLGATGTAVQWGERAVRLDPNKLTYVWYAYALKADGQLEAGLTVMRDARRRYPLDLDLAADMANWLTELGRPDDALVLIEEAMRIDPSYDCAVHTAYHLRFLRDGQVHHLIALADFIRDNPVTSHEHSDLAECCAGRPWLGQVTGPTEACVNTLRQVPAASRGRLSRLTLSGLEVPSALALVRRHSPGVALEISGPLPAGMTTPLRPGRVLWRYDGAVAYPTVEPPPVRAAELLVEVATPSWPHPVAAYDRALPLGQLPVEELLSLLVHPPARPAPMADLPDGWWERCAQVFACLGILHCAELGSGAPGDTAGRRALLTEIAFGVEDWTTEAALFALSVAAWLDPACRDEVREAVGQRFLAAVTAGRERAVTILGSLAALVHLVPDMVPDVTALATEVLTAVRDTDEPARPVPAVPAARRPLEGAAGRRSLLRRLSRRGPR
ncbi:MAG TPA: tetratricopeptide repeat protein [Rugosimonospora sp.]|nr:tetratricopeptide repeat protein [Rugosimonospora sp.]